MLDKNGVTAFRALLRVTTVDVAAVLALPLDPKTPKKVQQPHAICRLARNDNSVSLKSTRD
jgi:hypothetical protein